MAAVDPYAAVAAQKFDPTLHWKEDVRNYSPNGAGLFGPNGGEASLVGNVDFARTLAALRCFMGYSNVTPYYPTSPSPPGGYYLARTPPVYHPMYPRLVCVSAAADPFGPYPQTPAGGGAKTAKVAETALPDLPAGAPSGYNTIDGTSLGYMTGYRKSKITARFAPCPFRMLNDSQVHIVPGGQEWRRWCYVNSNASTSVISLTGFSQQYYEGTGTLSPISSPLGKKYPAEIGQVLLKLDLEIVWKSVPEEWIMARDSADNVVPFPRNLLLGLGTVNSTNFLNYLAGTLRLDAVKLERSAWPLAAGTESRFNYDVTMGCTFFDPPKGYTGNPPVQLNRVDGAGEPTDPRGHNCAPWAGTTNPNDINAAMWFGASFNGGATGRASFGTSEFRKLFNSPLNPY